MHTKSNLVGRIGSIALTASALCVAFTVFGQQRTPAPEKKNPVGVTVPFVGCPSDGQAGPIDPPKGHPVMLPLPATLAGRVALYSYFDSPAAGLLGPVGWHCFHSYGSGGGSLVVSPELHPEWKRFSGPAIELTVRHGSGSGALEVLSMMALVFPAHISEVNGFMTVEPELTKDFKLGPYPTDRLIYRDNDTVEYQTPPNTEGLGTHSMLLKNDRPIEGVTMLDHFRR